MATLCTSMILNRQWENVDDILAPIKPLFPTPHTITFDWHSIIALTESVNDFPFSCFSTWTLQRHSDSIVVQQDTCCIECPDGLDGLLDGWK